MQKPSIPKGTRDFGPSQSLRRAYIFDAIRAVFRKYGFMPIETPSMENLETLTGKYGDEGDKLIFKILNSGDYLADADSNALTTKNSKALIKSISEKALRYDLTVPFARFVVMNRNDITLPFKRYQIQPVWRADRPQKGRYREFTQCDADVVGSDSLILEAELVKIYDEALGNLGLRDFTIKINNRKILAGLAEMIGEADKFVSITVAIDKLDKIGADGVFKELTEAGLSAEAANKLLPILNLTGNNEERLITLSKLLSESEIGKKGIAETEEVLNYLKLSPPKTAKIELDITLARGLNYYTGAIFEVKANGVSIGSIGGGGRYDDLTGIFGMPGLSGVGISFGADRIYDVLEELNLFPDFSTSTTRILFVCMDLRALTFAFPIAEKLRAEDIVCEIYPDSGAKMKKQMSYADTRKIPFTVIIGDDEITSQQLTLKNMQTGEQQKIAVDALVKTLKNNNP